MYRIVQELIEPPRCSNCIAVATKWEKKTIICATFIMLYDVTSYRADDPLPLANACNGCGDA